MFFRSAKSPLLAIILIAVGSFQLIRGWTYADAAKRESATVGTIIRVIHGGRGGPTYEYLFKINGVMIEDQSDTCKTSLTSHLCSEGTLVRVYYDPKDLSTNLLQEFGAASRAKIFFGSWMVSCGLLLIALYFILNKIGKDSGESEESDERDGNDEPDVLHIAPGE